MGPGAVGTADEGVGMVNEKDETTRFRLKELHRKYLAQLPDKVRQIEKALSAVNQKWDAEKAGNLARMLHTLAGSAGTFGLSEVRAAAHAMESELRTDIKQGTALSDDFRVRITSRFTAVKEAAVLDDSAQNRMAAAPLLHETGRTTGNDTIFVVDDDPQVVHNLALQIGHYGYSVESFSRPGDLVAALKNATPSAIIMDLGFPEGRLAGAEILEEVQEGREPRIPVLFLSGRGDFEARLMAVRAGSEAYFTKPVDMSRLLDRLDVLTKRQVRASYRVLIVDDETELASYHEAILQQAGMTTAVVTDPLDVMDTLDVFRPELILMDVYMPRCNGLELAKVIRQNDAFIDVPIVFLSSETDIDRQLSAMSRGGDDFLSKPIQPSHLIISVSLRAERYRVLRTFMTQDSLTGLLNHTRIKEQLDIEVVRAQRQGLVCTLAMIDIDNFKFVNDTYGHPAGDQVLKSLSYLLKQRLRKTDFVGRYGGEEFAIIMGDTDGEMAKTILNDIRSNFSQVRHKYGDNEFAVTISCGLASFPHYEQCSELIYAADRALYEAKRSGRNQVVCAPPSLP